MKKNKYLGLLGFIPLCSPLLSISCINKTNKDEEKNIDYKDIPSDLISKTKNNYGIFYSEKLSNKKNEITSYDVYDRLMKNKNNLNEIEKIISPFAYLNFKYLDKKNYDYKLDIEKTKAYPTTLKLVFRVTDKTKNKNSHFVEYELKNFKKDVSKVNYKEAAGMKFYETVAKSGETIDSKQFIKNFKQYVSKNSSDIEKQIEYFKKYCQVDGDIDLSKYDFEFDITYLHDHGPSNIHTKIKYKAKDQIEWQEVDFHVFGFNSKTKENEFSLSYKKVGHDIKSFEFLKQLKTNKNWNAQKEFIKKYFDFVEKDNYKYFDYEIDFEKTKVPDRVVDWEDPDKGYESVKKNLTDDENIKYKLNLAVRKFDKFDKSKYEIIEFNLDQFGRNTYLGYLSIEELKNDSSYFNISNKELKSELTKEEFKKLSSEEQIKKLVSFLNKDFDEDKKPIKILEDLKDKFNLEIDHSFKIEIGRSSYFTFTWIKIKFIITNKLTNEKNEKIVTINGLDY